MGTMVRIGVVLLVMTLAASVGHAQSVAKDIELNPHEEAVSCGTTPHEVTTAWGNPWVVCDTARQVYVWAPKNALMIPAGTVVIRDRCSWHLRGYNDIPPLDCYQKKEGSAR